MTRLLNLLDEADVPEGSSSKTEIEERRPHDKLLQAAEYGAARCLYITFSKDFILYSNLMEIFFVFDTFF